MRRRWWVGGALAAWAVAAPAWWEEPGRPAGGLGVRRRFPARLLSRVGRPVPEIALEKKLLDEKLLKKILDPWRMTEPAPPLEEARKKPGKRTKR